MNPGELRTLMFSLGWKLHAEDTLMSMWVKTVSGKPREQVVRLLALVGITVISTTTHYILTPKPLNP